MQFNYTFMYLRYCLFKCFGYIRIPLTWFPFFFVLWLQKLGSIPPIFKEMCESSLITDYKLFSPVDFSHHGGIWSYVSSRAARIFRTYTFWKGRWQVMKTFLSSFFSFSQLMSLLNCTFAFINGWIILRMQDFLPFFTSIVGMN